MSAIEVGPDGTLSRLERVSLGADSGFSERWIQEHVYAHPDLIPLDRIEPGAGSMIPIAREFALSRSGGPVYLDCLGVTRTGRLVLVECKLWRNPQARREVVAQIIEYAALLKGLGYADLTAKLKALAPGRGPNPLYEHARSHGTNLDETIFVDSVSRSLEFGDFHLVIVGDGIRSDLHAIGAYINETLAAFSRLSLVELQVWKGAAGNLVVLPQLPLRTEIVKQRLVVDQAGAPVQLALEQAANIGAETREAVRTDQVGQRAANRVFWQAVIDSVRLDHPDQPPPRHGGDNWIRFSLPAGLWLTAYRWGRGPVEIGIFLPLSGSEGASIFSALSDEADAIRAETGLDIAFREERDDPFQAKLIVRNISEGPRDTAADIQWLAGAANSLVNSLRPRLAQLARGSDGEEAAN